MTLTGAFLLGAAWMYLLLWLSCESLAHSSRDRA